ncbi:MAG: SCO1664 family protein [Actinomycetia bacterium]|nr:SCO1664 family protein [Actinomycetes bacterium]
MLTPTRELPVDAALALLRDGELTIEGQLVGASNATFYCAVRADEVTASCVYKPAAGERSLWDFPDGTLAAREVAAYELSAVSGWAIVPPTVHRNGPLGPGMVQLWIDEDTGVDVLDLVRGAAASPLSQQLRRVAIFDAVVNNADRKGGHLLPTRGGHIYGVDHGLTFHTAPKLRTLLWQWAGAPLETDAVALLSRLRDGLGGGRAGALGVRLGELLSPHEVRATARRVEALLASGRYPMPMEGRPAIPWPPM